MSPVVHVDDEQLVRLASNEVDEPERSEIFAHLEICEDCATVWKAVEHLRSAAVEFDPGAVPGSEGAPAAPSQPYDEHRGRGNLWLGLAAAAVLAVGLAMLPQWLAPAKGPADAPRVVRSVETAGPRTLAPAEAEKVSNPAFTWTAVEGAAGYSVELLDGLGESLWLSDRTTESSAVWPEAVEQRPGSYFWRVFAHFEDGRERQPSALTSFELVGD